MCLCSRVIQCSDTNKKSTVEDVKKMGIPQGENGIDKKLHLRALADAV